MFLLQLQIAHGINKIQRQPFNFVFTGCDLTNVNVSSIIGPYAPFAEVHQIPYTVTKAHYLDLYPKDQLVYLSPHAREEMGEYDFNKKYIVGCLVDKATQEPFTMAQAKKEGIKCVKFPIDKYIL
jgi:ribonuclease P protein 1